MLLLLLLSQQGADSFADRLRIARKASGLTQQEVAGKVGIKQSTLSGLEKGASLSSTFTPKLAHVYGVNARWLATGEGQPVAGEAPNVSPGPDIQGSVPLISWVRGREAVFFRPREITNQYFIEKSIDSSYRFIDNPPIASPEAPAERQMGEEHGQNQVLQRCDG